jgi:preprotein translocase subunit SecG
LFDAYNVREKNKMLQSFFIIIISLVSIFLICLILIQRGRGGGLAGAFGGMGGQSAFGAKAGDVFTRATVFVVVIWFLLCISSILLLSRVQQGGLINRLSDKPATTTQQPTQPSQTTTQPPQSTTPVTTPIPATSPTEPPAKP